MSKRLEKHILALSRIYQQCFNESTMQTAHVLYGPVAAGKSSLAIKLAIEHRATRFTIDEWMHTLFGPDVRADMDMTWAMTRVARCRTTILATCLQILGSGKDVVLELGLMREKDRDQISSVIEAAGHRAQFYFVDADIATRRQRVSARNARKGATDSFDVTPAMFDAIESYFERPTAQERHHTFVTETQSHD